MASFTWIGIGGADYNDPTNWSPTGVPGPNDVAIITSNGPNAGGMDLSGTIDLAGAPPEDFANLLLDGGVIAANGTINLVSGIDEIAGSFINRGTIESDDAPAGSRLTLGAGASPGIVRQRRPDRRGGGRRVEYRRPG